jgi:two-component system C4-dicarboxylate transport sensor histidine kinase DctB
MTTTLRPPNLADPIVRRWAAYIGASAIILAAVVGFAGAVAERRAEGDLARQAQTSAALHAAVLRSELAKHRALPYVLAQDPDVAETLRSANPAGIDALNRKLETLSGGTRAAVIYVLDAKGMTIAASNWREPTSFVGSDYSFRPYFKEASAKGVAELFALGTVSRRPGLFMSRRVEGREGMLGVVVVKVEFEALEAEWSEAEPAFVADPRGVILVTSIPAWRFSTLGRLPRAEQDQLRTEHRFGDAPFSVLKANPTPVHGRPPVLTSATTPDGDARFMAASADLGVAGWTIFTFTPVGETLRAAVAGARAIALLVGLIVCGITFALLRWRGQASIRAARQEAARLELETRVAERTTELRETNQRLVVEIEERRRAEAHVHLMQDELVQSNKLATLGQIAAGVAHEINQPVAAIRAYADNAAAFLDRADQKTAKANLGLIAGLTERIGLITDELRAFARKSSAPAAPVIVREAVDGALLLVGPRVRQQHVRIVRGEADEEAAKVMAERFRLEQVLVNLLQNALEALEDTANPEIRVQVVVKRSQVRIVVADNGPGVTPEAAKSLFTPFATTKPRGLGLGLVISRDIIAEFRGELSLEPAPSGARFVMSLPKART